MPSASSPFDQSFFQIGLEWGAEGLARLAPADIVVVVDVLRFSTQAVDAAAAGRTLPLAGSGSVNGARVAAAASGAVVVAGCLRNAGAVARWIVAEQHRRGDRVRVAVIPAGELTGPSEPGPSQGGCVRVAIEDQLGAGAVIAALGDLGLDHSSPEAAVACEAFRSLRGAVRHLLLASGSGQELVDRGLRDDVLHAAEIDVDDVVPVLRDGVFRAGSH
ncbi:2-phosphosulfolactate phosphatase [Microbacterium sp.]|uniref:2-phosphosulfolactate phosphatase n=1 Tax=Microbacterium sp. TaxID=51671 RepID=UPI003A926698